MIKMINPILKREVTSKIRSWKFAGVITLYGLVLFFFSLMFFYSIRSRGNTISLNGVNGAFVSLIMFIYVIICFISPALTSSSINSEKMGRTLDLLICAPISSKKIIIGKILSSSVTVVFLLIVTMPLFSLLFMFGGLSMLDILFFLLYFLVAIIYYGSIGVFFSSFFNKITASTVISYIVVFFLNVGTIIISMAVPEIFDFSKSMEEIFSYILYLNPGYGLVILVSRTTNEMGSVSMNNISDTTGLTIVVIVAILLSLIFGYLAVRRISTLKE
jgi:ABC-type transport system involved in multi-copper enzyme maturation permease subunit